jgi:hypothetical protein
MFYKNKTSPGQFPFTTSNRPSWPHSLFFTHFPLMAQLVGLLSHRGSPVASALTQLPGPNPTGIPEIRRNPTRG